MEAQATDKTSLLEERRTIDSGENSGQSDDRRTIDSGENSGQSDDRITMDSGENSGQSDDRITRDSGENSGQSDEECGYLSSCLVILSFIATASLYVMLIAFAVLYGLEVHVVDHRKYFNVHQDKGNTCSVQIQSNSQKMFEQLAIIKKKNTIFVTLHLNQNVDTANNSRVYKPSKLMWTDSTTYVLEWPEMYAIWSFGFLDLGTERNVQLHVDLYPPGCTFEWGLRSSTEAIATALLNMTKQLTNNGYIRAINNMWCYRVMLFDKNSTLFDRYFSFIVREIGYQCCRFGTDNSAKCDMNIEPKKALTDIPFAFAFLTLLISPILFVYVYQYLSPKAHVYWIHQIHHPTDSPDGECTKNEWTFTDYKSPITFLSCLRKMLPMCEKTCCTSFCYKLAKAIGIVIFSLTFVVFYVLLGLPSEGHEMIIDAIDDDIPVGFLSFLNPSFKNENFLPLNISPWMFLGLYLILGICYIIIYQYLREKTHIIECLENRFGLNLCLIQEHGRINCASPKDFGLFELIHANYRAVFSCGFIKDSLIEKNHNNVIVICFCKILKFLRFLIINVVPLGFASHFILVFVIQNIMYCVLECCMSESCVSKCTGVFLKCIKTLIALLFMVLHIFLVYCFVTIYFASAEFIMLLFTFCCMSIVIYPSAAAGAFIGMIAGLYVIMKIFHDIAKRYAYYRDLSISVSEEICEKWSASEARLDKNDKNKVTLCVTGVNIKFIIHIKIVSTTNQKTEFGDLKCFRDEKTLTIEGRGIDKIDDFSINAFDFSINALTIMEGKLAVGTSHVPTTSEEPRHLLYVIELRPRHIEFTDYKENEMRRSKEKVNGEDPCFVLYRNGLPGIPTKLWEKVVRDYIPIGTEIVRGFIRIVIICCIIGFIIAIITWYEQLVNLNTITTALVTIFLVRLTALGDQFSIDVNETQQTEILKRQIRRTILEYWTQEKYGTVGEEKDERS